MNDRILIYENGKQKAVDKDKFINDSEIHTINAEKCTHQSIIHITQQRAELYKFFYMTSVGKEGYWYYDENDFTSEDNFGTIRVTTWGGRLKRIYSDFIFPEWFDASDIINDGIHDCTATIQRVFDFANVNNIGVKFKFGEYLCGKVYVGLCRIKEITSENTNIGEATNSKKTTIVSRDENQEYIWKFGGHEDFSGYTEVESLSAKGMKISINFTTKYKKIIKGCLCLETFTSGDLHIGFYEVLGRPLYFKNAWETEITAYFRRIKNFGDTLIYCDDALINIGANTSELNFKKITVGQTDCTIIKATPLSYFGKINIESLIFEHNGIFFPEQTANPLRNQLDNATSIPLFDFGYADGVMMTNISLCGLNKTMMSKDGTDYKYVIFRLTGRNTITANICVYDCNCTTYLADGQGIENGLLNVTLTNAIFNRSIDASLNEELTTVTLLEKGVVNLVDFSKKNIQTKYYSANELFQIVRQQNVNGKPYFSPVRSAGIEYLEKTKFNYQVFLEGASKFGLKARIGIFSDNNAFNIQYISDVQTITNAIDITANTWNEIDIDLYSLTNNSTSFNLRSVNSTDIIRLKFIEFYFEYDKYSGTTAQRPDLEKILYFNTSSSKLQRKISGVWYNIQGFFDTVIATGGTAVGSLYNPVINASANNDVLIGTDDNPTLNDNGFLNVKKWARKLSGSTWLNGHVFPQVDNAWTIGDTTYNIAAVRARVYEATSGKLTIGTSTSYEVDFKSNGRIYGRMYTDGCLLLQDPANTFSNSGDRLQIDGSINIKSGKLKINESGASPSCGVCTLIGGTATISTGAVTASSRIIISPQEGGQYNGKVRISNRIIGTSFTINSSDNTDSCTIAWQIIN